MTSGLLHIPAALDLSAVAVGAVGGAATATGRAVADRIDVLGVAIVGIATGLGGSVLRDVLLGEPPAALFGGRYLLAALAASVAGMAFAHWIIRASLGIALLDAVSIGLYLALGITKAQYAGLPIPGAVLVGIVACTGGGLLRDLLLGDPVAVVRVGSWYITAALSAAAVFLICERFTGLGTATAVTVFTASTLRVLALLRAWTSPLARPFTLPSAR
ncbi:trimeric intracellular cation channel family protein [Nocardia sp. NPDC052566]|uniref:trimeric intracellular cation channel family protein n=1 Tax=Nocardia sp. NPDC052566 TaxID=3364330 RepID=UPI0037C5D2CE